MCVPHDSQEENLITVGASLERFPSYIYYRFCFHQNLLFIFYDVQINAIIYVTN
jgi:hypothetical protein